MSFVELANYEIKIKNYVLYLNYIEWFKHRKVICFDYMDKTWKLGETRIIKKDLTGYFFKFKKQKINISGLIETIIMGRENE